MKLVFSIPERVHGSGAVKFSWQPTGNHIATAGINNKVLIFDRHGEQVDEIVVPGAVTSMAWDKDGDLLAVTNAGSNQIVLWDLNTRRTQHIDSSMGVRDALTFAVWSQVSLVLAVGNNKGNLLLYNHQTQRKDPIIGKHTKQITCGAFNRRDVLALGGDDQQITINSIDGELMHSFACNANPSMIQFGDVKSSGERTGSGGQQQSTVSAIVGKRILMLINMQEPENPVNLQFQTRYGDIVAYRWYGDGYVLIAFEQGYLVAVSTHVSEIGSEIFSVQEHKSYMSHVTISQSFDKVVSTGDNCVKVRELSQLSQVYAIVELDSEDKGLGVVEMNADGQLMAVSGQYGSVYIYLTKLPVLGATCGTRIAILTSLTEITIQNDVEQESPITFHTEVEPSFLGIGPSHVAVGMNNRAAFYVISRQGAELIRDFEYLGSVTEMQLNATYAAALLDGRVQLHRIQDSQNDSMLEGRVFPENGKARVLSMALTAEFLILGTEAGNILMFYLEDWKTVNDYRHGTGIKSLYPEPSGTRLCVIDNKRDIYVYSPVDDSIIAVPQGDIAVVKGVLWETWANDRDVMILYDANAMHTFIYQRDHLIGPDIKMIGSTKLPYGHVPLLLHNGDVTCQTQSGRTSSVRLQTHLFDTQTERKPDQEIKLQLDNCLLLKRWLNAWRICEHKKDTGLWRRFGEAALSCMEIELAIRIYRQLRDVGMVWSLEELLGIEDRNLLAGHVAMLLDRFDLAEKLYLDSSQPMEALEMRRDLLHWERALQLAVRLAPDQAAHISKEYAQQLEYMGEYGNALVHFEQGMLPDTPENKAHNDSCQCGIARMCLRQGDIHRGVQLAAQSNQRSFKKQCAQILETIKQFNEASQLYEQGQFYDRAAAVCIKAKNWFQGIRCVDIDWQSIVFPAVLSQQHSCDRTH